MPNPLWKEKAAQILGAYTIGNIVAVGLSVLFAIVAVSSNAVYKEVPASNVAVYGSIILAIGLFPRVFNRLPKGKRLYLSVIAAVAILSQLVSPGNRSSSPSPAVDLGNADAAKVKACFGTFSGTIDALRDQVKASLNDPSSFELVSTDLDQASDRNVTMTFRTKNQFNATVLASVDAEVNPDTCAVETVDQPKVD